MQLLIEGEKSPIDPSKDTKKKKKWNQKEKAYLKSL